MSFFTDQKFQIEFSPDAKHGTIVKPFAYYSGYLGRLIVIPAGFVTDGTSIPMAFQNLISVWGKQAEAAVVHDYLYRWQRFPRADADRVFLEAMKVKGVARLTRWTIYLAVRAGGAAAWRNDQRQPLPRDQVAPNLFSVADEGEFESGFNPS